MAKTIQLTRPLPKGYELSTGPNGTVSVHCADDPGHFYSLAAWAQIERGKGLWRDAHDAIFGTSV